MLPIVTITRTARVERVLDLPFSCAWCQVTTRAQVWVQGVHHDEALYGVGQLSDNENLAVAWRNAEWNAWSELQRSACPRCGKFAPELVERVARENARY